MKQKTTTEQSASTVCYEMIETKARERIQSWLQDLLEEEVTEFLGRAKSQRRCETSVRAGAAGVGGVGPGRAGDHARGEDADRRAIRDGGRGGG